MFGSWPATKELLQPSLQVARHNLTDFGLCEVDAGGVWEGQFGDSLEADAMRRGVGQRARQRIVQRQEARRVVDSITTKRVWKARYSHEGLDVPGLVRGG